MRHSHCLLISLLIASSLACGSDPPPAAAPVVEAKLQAKGTLAAVLGGNPVTLDYNGLTVQVGANHRLNSDPKGYGCITKLSLAIEKADGTCRLELVFAPSPAGPKLSGGKFHAVRAQISDGQTVSLQKCVGFPDTDKATKEKVFEILPADAVTINFGPLGPGKANQKLARMDNLKLAIAGELSMKNIGTKYSFALSTLTFEGSIESIGDPAGDCGGMVGKTGASECNKQGKPGENVGETYRRETRPFLCDTDTQDYDLGELCGNDVIWIIDWRQWAKNGILKEISQVRGAFKGKNIGVAVVVVEGSSKIPVEDPPGSGTFKPLGPAPAVTECQAVAVDNNIPKDVVMLFDKEKQLTYQGKKLTNSKYIPAMLFAKADGTIVKILPDVDGKEPGLGDLTAAVQLVLDTP